MVSAGVLIMRKTNPDIKRPFKVPFCPWFPVLGIFICGYLIIQAVPQLSLSAFLFPLWLLIGAVIYFSYGYHKNRQAEKNELILQVQNEKKEENECIN